jgi:hypothetical protein
MGTINRCANIYMSLTIYHRSRDRMVVGLTITYAISVYRHKR